VDRLTILHDRNAGMSLNELAKTHRISKASVCRVLKESKAPVSEGLIPAASASTDDKQLRPPTTAA
jgi:hypothetical protein